MAMVKFVILVQSNLNYNHINNQQGKRYSIIYDSIRNTIFQDNYRYHVPEVYIKTIFAYIEYIAKRIPLIALK